MNKRISTFFCACAALTACAAFSLDASASDFSSKHAANGVACTACHGSGAGAAVKAPKASACLACHQQDAVVKATERLNFEAVLVDPKTKKEIRHTALINPHDSYHFGRTESCFDCHREHRPSQNACESCHDIGAWKMGAPR